VVRARGALPGGAIVRVGGATGAGGALVPYEVFEHYERAGEMRWLSRC